MNRKKDYFCTTIKFIENPTQTHWMKHYLWMPKQSIKTYSFLRTTSAVAKPPPPAGTPSIIEGEIPPRR